MGYGDDIMVTAEARRLRKKHPDARILVGDGAKQYWSELFDNNPNITRVDEVTDRDEVVWLRNYFGARPYLNYPVAADRQTFRAYRASPGEIFLSLPDRQFSGDFISELPDSPEPCVYIEPNVDFGVCKDWGFGRYQEVVDLLKGHVTFVQADYGKPLLDGVFSFDSGSFLRACAVLSRLDLYVGPEGGMHHAAAAFSLPGVVIFGGRISPSITGYSCHHNLYVDLPGSPCGSIAPCDHCRACFDRISPGDVARLLMQTLGNSRIQDDRTASKMMFVDRPGEVSVPTINSS